MFVICMYDTVMDNIHNICKWIPDELLDKIQNDRKKNNVIFFIACLMFT